jgi:hypothetical protein
MKHLWKLVLGSVMVAQGRGVLAANDRALWRALG